MAVFAFATIFADGCSKDSSGPPSMVPDDVGFFDALPPAPDVDDFMDDAGVPDVRIVPPDTGVRDTGPSVVPRTARSLIEDATLFSNPLAVAGATDGSGAVFFSAVAADASAAIYRIDTTGTTSLLAKGSPLTLPVALLADATGDNLYVADLGAGAQGALLRISIATGAIDVVFDNGDIADPSGLAYHAATDTLYIAGTSANTLQGGVWSMQPGDVMPLQFLLDPAVTLYDPSGIAVGPATQNVYIYDALDRSSQLGIIYKVTPDGTTTRIAQNLPTGYPAGMAIAHDEQFLLVSTSTPTRAGGDTVHAINLANNARAPTTLGQPLVEPRAVHLLTLTNRWLVVDGLGGAAGTGVIYRLE